MNTMLHELPIDHPDRNRVLPGCWYRYVGKKTWHEVKPTFAIAGCTYNQLGAAWTDHLEWCWQPDR